MLKDPDITFEISDIKNYNRLICSRCKVRPILKDIYRNRERETQWWDLECPKCKRLVRVFND